MSQKNNVDHHAYIDAVISYYITQGRTCVFIPPIDVRENEWVGIDFLIDSQLVVRYVIPIDTQNFYAGVLVGVGPRFVEPCFLLGEHSEPILSDASINAVAHNLWHLDQILKKISIFSKG